VLCKTIGKISENKQIFKSERHELLFHEHLQFSKTIRLDLAQTANKGCWRPGTPERGLGWGGSKKLRAMEIYEKQKSRYQLCWVLFNNNVDLKNSKVNYRKFVSIRS